MVDINREAAPVIPNGYAEVSFAKKDLSWILEANLSGQGIGQEFLHMERGLVTFSDQYAPYGRHWAESVLVRQKIPFDAFSARIPELHDKGMREWRSGRWTRWGWLIIRTPCGEGCLSLSPARHFTVCQPLNVAVCPLWATSDSQAIAAQE